MADIIKTTFQLRRGYEAAWNRNNPVLASGEPGFVIDKNILKIGDGHTHWVDLKPIGIEEDKAIELFGDNKSVIISGDEISIMGFEEALPGAQPIKTEEGVLAWVVPNTTVEEVNNALTEFKSKVYTKEEINVLYGNRVKFEIFSKPEEVVVDGDEHEIRILCPKNTTWKLQNPGENGNPNMYYLGFRAYAPEGAVGFKEGVTGIVEDEYFDFKGSFAGTDKYGRNFSTVWLAAAQYDAATDTWTYFGAKSTTKKYLGWDYIVEWYDANGAMIHNDTVRINLSNEDCHNFIKPYYMGSIDTNTLTQKAGEILVLYGGSASDNI